MKQALATTAAALSMTANAIGGTAWDVDNVHSSVKFSVRHLVISEVEGAFKLYSGTVQSSSADFAEASVEFSVDVNSLSTDNEMRDNHLKSDDFFNAEKFPRMTFKSTSWKKIDDQNFVVEGNLTIRNVTRKVAFQVVYGGTMKDPYGNVKAGFKATAKINRFDYDLKWNVLTEAGGATVGRDVEIVVKLELAQKQS